MIPVTVRLSNSNVDVHITNRLATAPSWRTSIPGGFASATFSLNRPINVNDPMLAAFTRVYIYDGRNGETLWEGRLQLSGRSAGDQGQVWALTAIGPSAHALDQTATLVYIDTRLEPWHRSNYEAALMPAGANVSVTNHPHTTVFDVVLCQFPSGLPISNTNRVAALYDLLVGSGMQIGAVGFSWDSGFSSVSSFFCQMGTGVSPTYLETPFSSVVNTGGGTFTGWVVTDIPAGRDFAAIRLNNTSAGAVTVADDVHWNSFANLRVVGRRMNKSGALLSGSAGLLSSIFVRATWVIEDLLARLLPQYDGPNAALTALDTADIDQLTYEDPATANQVLDDLMALEPGSYWAAWESGGSTTATVTNGRYRFEWSNWPTTPRYHASVADGFDSPAPTFEVYNRTKVRYRDPRGIIRTYSGSKAVPMLDDQGLIRTAYIDLGDESGSAVNAAIVSFNFLNDHALPTSGGTLTIARPIRDVVAGKLLMPWQIRPGAMITVHGIEASALTGAGSRDGLTTFRIVSVEVSPEGVATLELDMFTPTESRALAAIAKKRSRRR
jgi:hypothetical protein